MTVTYKLDRNGIIDGKIVTDSTLPDKPSELIRLALSDLNQVEAMDDTYKINMEVWHTPLSSFKGQICRVCLAGAVMANTMQVPLTLDMEPYDFEDIKIRKRLQSLNHFRLGAILSGIMTFYEIETPMLGKWMEFGTFQKHMERLQLRGIPPIPHDFAVINVPNYQEFRPEGFKRAMRAIADRLKELGY